MGKKTIAVLLSIFLLLFPHYAPWGPHYTSSHSWIGQIFTLYFFVANQALGIIHEAGHGVCYIFPCPQFLMVLNGTLFQVFFPVGVMVYYKKRKNDFGAYIALFFTGFSLLYTAWYMSTAHEGAVLPASKSFLGVDAIHDFHYIFTALGILEYESFISGFTRLVGYFLMIYSIVRLLFEAFKDHHKKNLRQKFINSH